MSSVLTRELCNNMSTFNFYFRSFSPIFEQFQYSSELSNIQLELSNLLAHALFIFTVTLHAELHSRSRAADTPEARQRILRIDSSTLTRKSSLKSFKNVYCLANKQYGIRPGVPDWLNSLCHRSNTETY